MLLAGVAVSAAIDLLSQLQPQDLSAKSIIGPGRPSFEIGGAAAAHASPTDAAPTAASRGGSLSLETLLSAQSEAQATRKQRSMSVLLDLLQSSQDGGVEKAKFEAASGQSDGEASELFDRIDQNQDDTVNLAELSAFLDSYRRSSEAGTSGRAARALAVVA